MDVKTLKSKLDYKNLIIAILAIALMASLVQATNYAGTQTNLYPYNAPFQPYSYVNGIFNSTYYYGQNGTTNNYDYLGTNALTMLTYEISHLSPNGGIIFWRSGIYWFTNTILLNKDCVKLKGEGMGGATNANGTTLELSNGANVNLMNITGTDDTLEDLALNGNFAGQSVTNKDTLFINQGHHDFITQCTITNGARYNVYLYGCDVVIFSQCEIDYARIYGMYVYSSIQVMLEDGSHVRSNGWGATTMYAAGVVFNGTCSECGAEGSFIDYNRNGTSTYYGYGVVEQGSSLKSMIYIGNGGVGDPQGLFSHLVSVGSTFYGNVYHQTFPSGLPGEPLTGSFENSATATVANGEWVSHNLTAAPTVVTITTRTATYGTPAMPVIVGWVNQNSTKFQVSVYWANGTAITADAINISWSAEYKP